MKPKARKSIVYTAENPLEEGIPTQNGSFPVVAVGASAGGLEAYREFFHALPADTGMAFVLVQHLDPNHQSMLAEIIAKETTMPVEEVKSGVKVQPNRLYVIPPNAFMALTGDVFTLTPRGKGPGQHLAVNFFMRSLAESRGVRAIGVIFSGTGSDGTLGLESIKAEGGITFAQDPATAKYDGMPQSAIDSGCVDLVLRPKAIAEELRRIQGHPYIHQEKREKEVAEAELSQRSEKDFTTVLDHLRKSSGVDFSQYRPSTIHRRALRRMVILKLDSLGEYAKHMKEHPEEGQKLYDDILIPVTSFFRDFEAFEALKTHVYPAIVQDKGNKGNIRMWAPGCSTGEETYSLAMTLLEFLGDKASSFQIQIFGTDLNEKGIQKARAGLYRQSIAEEISPERLSRFFVKADDGYRVNKAVRDMCVFARQNLASDPPFSQMNLVACRNLLIYIQPVLQKKIIPILHYALKPAGFLLLGSSESISAFPDLFSTVDKKCKIYGKKAGASRLPYDFRQTYHPAERSLGPSGRALKAQESPESELDVQAEADSLVLMNHAPVGVIVNSAMDVIQYRGRTTPYLESPPGKPSVNVLKLARNGLSIELRTLLSAASKQGAAVRKDGVPFGDDGHKQILNLSVSPLGSKDSREKRFFLILFDDVTLSSPADPGAMPQRPDGRGEIKSRIAQLKQELAAAHDALTSAVESEEAVREEFQSANEEILSANEELQSTNEELETSKEELQSANEELNTLNEELRNRNVDLSQLSNDLENLIDAIRIPILFVGADLRIRRITSAATAIFRVLPTDIGRPITDIKHSLDVPDLAKLIEQTIANLTSTEREVQDTEGHWRSLEIRPYRTADNRIEGAILALPDIDRLKHSEQYLKQIIDNVPSPLLVLDADMKVLLANLTFCTTFNVSQANTTGQLLYRLGDEQWNIPKLRELLEEVLPKKQLVKDFVVTHEFPGIGWQTMLVSGRRIENVSGVGAAMILLAIENITERARNDETQSRLAAIIESSDDAIISKNLDGIITSWNQAAHRMFGYTGEEIIGQSMLRLVPKPLHPEESEIIRRLTRGERILNYETTRIKKDGEAIDVSLTISPVKNGTDKVIGTSKIARDISGKKKMEQLVIQADKLATMGRMAATIAHEVNNPLASVLNLIFLARTNNGTPEAAAYLLTAETEIERVSHISRQTLGYYRDLGSPVELFLHDVIEEVLKVYQSKLQTRNITVERVFDDSLPITASKGEMVQVFSNILANSVDSMLNGGLISIEIRGVSGVREQGLEIVIQDQGTGIAEEYLTKAFEPFFTTKGNIGTGIGLWVSRQLVEKRGGKITLTSDTNAENHGTRVVVSLPFSSLPVSVVDAIGIKSELDLATAPTT